MKLQIGDIVKFNPNANYASFPVDWRVIVVKCIKYNNFFIIKKNNDGQAMLNNYNNKVMLPHNSFYVSVVDKYFIKIKEIKK